MRALPNCPRPGWPGWNPKGAGAGEVITRLGLRLWRSESVEERVAIPIRDCQGGLHNIRLYQPGAAQNKMRLLGQGLRERKALDAPAMKAHTQIWLCEGEADCICALSHGLKAVTATGGAGTWKLEWNEAFKDLDVVICYDADQKGWAGAHKAGKHIAKVSASVRIIKWPGPHAGS